MHFNDLIQCGSSPDANDKISLVSPNTNEVTLRDSATNANDTTNDQHNRRSDQFKILLHGGSGTKTTTAIRTVMEQALRLAAAAIISGKTSLDAVQIATEAMENSGILNAGKGSVRTLLNKVDVTHEMDAAIMDGRNLDAGAVGAITTIKNPIRAARAILDDKERVFMVGPGAEDYLRLRFSNIEYIDPTKYFEKKDSVVDTNTECHGTVGAVAIDRLGNLAAATSTGGTDLKPTGRIGDSPLIGAGTYANNNSCAVSATGKGECIIRASLAMRIAAGIEYGNLTLAESADKAMKLFENIGGFGGIIAIDKNAKTHIGAMANMPAASIDETGNIEWFEFNATR